MRGRRRQGTWRLVIALGLCAACASEEPELDGVTSPSAWPDAQSAGGAPDAGAATAPLPPAQDAGSARSDASLLDAGRRSDAASTSRDASSPARADASSAAEGGAAPQADAGASGTCAVMPIPDALRSSYRMGAIYKRYADADGVPVIASEKPSEESIRRACLLVLDYARVRADVREALLNRKVRFIMMAKSEKTVNFPEYAALGDLDMRARGLGGVTDAICAEENVMCDRASDRWRGESICVHEYAHTMHSGAWNVAIPDFNTRLDAAFRAALAAGKYESTYAGSKLSEYLAEGVQDWYNTNLESATPNGIHNHINTRAELEQYDPALYAILKEVLPDRPSFRDCYYYE